VQSGIGVTKLSLLKKQIKVDNLCLPWYINNKGKGSHSMMIWNYKKRKKSLETIGLAETIGSVSASLMILLIITGLVLRENIHEGQKTRKACRAN
jgi:hypothetical protein